ncbi:MAG TPA: START domain-containing protein [Terriglobales bacterium]|nr:START domain-containing protein [Terriglobales bacterium]
MKSAAATAKKSNWMGKFSKVALVIILVSIAGVSILHLIWKYSGSSQWKLELDKDGVQVYSLKSPGSTLKHYRIVSRIKTTLNRVVANFRDDSLQNCKDWIPGCASENTIESWNSQGQYSILDYRVNLPFPFSPRELVVKEQFSQDPQSKSVFIDVMAVPDALPEDKCCVRVTHMHNRWRWTPLKNGEVEVEIMEDMDPQLPYVLTNSRAAGLCKFLSRVPTLLNKEQYQNQKFDFIQEPST